MTKEEAIQVIRANGLYYVPQNTPIFEMLIDAFNMAIEALKQPEPKMGKWLSPGHLGDTYRDHWWCSECQTYFKLKTNYCPNCGADMRGEG